MKTSDWKSKLLIKY